MPAPPVCTDIWSSKVCKLASPLAFLLNEQQDPAQSSPVPHRIHPCKPQVSWYLLPGFLALTHYMYEYELQMQIASTTDPNTKIYVLPPSSASQPVSQQLENASIWFRTTRFETLLIWSGFGQLSDTLLSPDPTVLTWKELKIREWWRVT